MPRITVPLVDNYSIISRPVAMGIARDVKRLCAIDEDTPVYMPGEFEQINTPNTAQGESGQAVFESYARLMVVAEDFTRNESVLNQVVRQNDLPPIISDDRLGISVRPVYMQSDISLSFRYIAATRQQAIKWRDEFAARRAENRTSISHEIHYNIPIQDGVINLLAHLHSLREKIAGYGESFPDWFQSIQKRDVSALGTQNGDYEKLLVTVPEKQVEITGWFDFNEIPREVKVADNSTWEIQFTYKLMYHRCTHLYIAYPLLVHQSHISKQFFDPLPRYAIQDLPKRGGIGVQALDSINGNFGGLPPPKDGIRFPAYDEWIPAPRSQPPNSVSAMNWLIKLDPKDPQDLMSLTQIPDLRFTLEMDTYLKLIHTKLHKRGGGLCFLTLYANDLPIDESILTIDADLNVRATKPLDLRRQYHLRLSFPTAYFLFNKATIREMQEHWVAALQVFQSIVPALDVEYPKTLLLADRYLPETYIAWFYKYLQDHRIGFEDGTGGPGGHVNTGTGEGGGLPQGGGIDGIGGPGGPNSGDNWTDSIWKRRGMNGMHLVQWLSITHLKQ